MKSSLILVLVFVASILAVGCGQQAGPQITETSEERDARRAAAFQEAEDEAQRRFALLIVEEAVSGFRVLHAERRYPEDLSELVTEGMMTSLPDLPAGMKYTYDSEAGTVDVVPVSDGTAEQADAGAEVDGEVDE